MQDQPLPFFLTLSAEAQFFEAGFCFGFNKLKFELFLPEETALEATNLLGKGLSKSLSDVQVSARGTNHFPSWEMTVASGIIDGHFVTNSDPLCELISHSIGDEVEAELTAQLWDSSLTKQDGELIFALSAWTLSLQRPILQRRRFTTISRARMIWSLRISRRATSPI
ncbi:MAG: hypothetical protein ABJL99_08690 [Aliishimia sp.]